MLKTFRVALTALLALVCVVSYTTCALAQAAQVPNGKQCFQAVTGINGMVGTLGAITGGSGGTAGTYSNVALTGGSGTGATANITVSGGAVSSVVILNPGINYAVADSLSAASANIGGVSGFSVPVASIAINSSLAGGSVGMYIPGTLTPSQTWKNANQTTLNTNPILLDSNGCAIIYGAGTYRQIVYDSLGNEVWDQVTTVSTANPYWAGTAAGTANAITVTDGSFSAVDGQSISFLAHATNTSGATLNPSGYGAIQIYKNSLSGPVALTGGEIIAGNLVTVTYSSSLGKFVMQNSSGQSYKGAGANSVQTTVQTKLQSTTPLDLVADYGADPTGVANSTTAFNHWFADGCALKKPLTAPSGTYLLTNGVVWDFASCPYGFILEGQSMNNVNFNFVGSGVGWQWIVSGGSGPLSIVPHVFDTFGNFTVTCNTNDVCLKLGQDNGADVFEVNEIHKIYAHNSSTGTNAVAWRINNFNATTFTAIDAGVNPATTVAPGNGVALQIVSATFNVFNTISVGNAFTGVQFTDLGNANVGFNYSDVFLSPDIENTTAAVELRNTANSATTRVTFIGGQIYTIYGTGYIFANHQTSPNGCCGNISATNFNNPQQVLYPPNGAYTGSLVVDPANSGGIQVNGYYSSNYTASITLPGSMSSCSTNMVKNTMGQTQYVTIEGGGFSAVCWRGVTYFVSSTYTFPWEPNDSFGVTYSVAPAVFQVPMH